jgi:squalene cyclase
MSTRTRTAIVHAIAAGLEYVVGLQATDGSWTEWELPPGRSSTWTTGFVGYKLRVLPLGLAQRALAAKRRAAEWLAGAEFTDGGWGYNDLVGPDADSTAFGILFLSSQGNSISTTSYDRLLSFHNDDGGFSTYIARDCHDSWGVSHADVSPIALLAVLTKYPSTSILVTRGVDYVLRQQATSGLWNSFWWESPLYATEANLSLLSTVRPKFDTAKSYESLFNMQPQNAFEVALLLSSISYVGSVYRSDASGRLVDWLIQQQQADGSWESAPILRVTERDCFEPWEGGYSGARFADPTRLFTCSVVLEALSKVAEMAG